MNRYLATEKLPKLLDEKRSQIQHLTKIITTPTMSEKDLLQIEADIRSLNEEITKLSDKKTSKTGTGQDKLALFRQQATIIAKKKETAADKLHVLNEEHHKLSTEIEDKKEALKGLQGSKILKGEEFKKYVSDLRNKSNVYKKKKADLSELSAEGGVLERTAQVRTNLTPVYRPPNHTSHH